MTVAERLNPVLPVLFAPLRPQPTAMQFVPFAGTAPVFIGRGRTV